GMTPAAYRRGGRGLTLSYTIADCALGRVLVAATERGICALKLGDDDAHLRADLEREYPAAVLREDNVRLRPWVRDLLAIQNGSLAGYRWGIERKQALLEQEQTSPPLAGGV